MMKYVFILLVLYSCSNQTPQAEGDRHDSISVNQGSGISAPHQSGNAEINFKKLSWLAGAWHLVTGKRHQSEIWKKQGDTAYEGIGFLIQGKDTVSFENIRIFRKDQQIIYEAKVRGQNNQQFVPFELVNAATNELKFINPGHDYPQEILYTHVSDKFMVVKVSGKLNSKQKIREFPMMKKD